MCFSPLCKFFLHFPFVPLPLSFFLFSYHSFFFLTILSSFLPLFLDSVLNSFCLIFRLCATSYISSSSMVYFKGFLLPVKVSSKTGCFFSLSLIHCYSNKLKVFPLGLAFVSFTSTLFLPEQIRKTGSVGKCQRVKKRSQRESFLPSRHKHSFQDFERDCLCEKENPFPLKLRF